KPSDALPVKIEAPKELPKISLVNESLKKLKFHLAKFDNVVKIRTTPNARTEGKWGFEHMKAVFNNEIIPFLKSLKDIFNVFDRDLLNEIIEVQTVFDQMDVAVYQSLVDKQCLEIAKKELLLENDQLLQQIMSQDVLLTVEAHIDYLKYTQEQADILRRIVKHAKAKKPLDNALDFSYNVIEFLNQTLREFYENVGISYQTSVARTPQQNGVVERRNWTLVEATRTMLIFSKASLFLWAEAINIACYTQKCSLIHLRYNKTPYELMQDKKPDLSFFHVFGALYYPTIDNDDLGKLDAKLNIGIIVGYAPAKKAFRIYNKGTQKIIETIHVTFDELTAMDSEQFSSGLGFQCMTPTTSSSGLVPNTVSRQPHIPPSIDD
nr:retrovirus-related Pol polyprotein from transposon TNT 1-94 [Tanacetum cinerariifolium]